MHWNKSYFDYCTSCLEDNFEIALFKILHAVSFKIRLRRDHPRRLHPAIADDFREGLYARTLSRGIRRSVSAAVLVREY